MGLTLEFYVGNAEEIATVILDLGYEESDEDNLLVRLSQAERSADFSLHLKISDLEFLSEQAGLVRNKPAIYLRDSFEKILVEEPAHGAVQIARAWISQFANLPTWSSRELTVHWFDAMSKHHGDSFLANAAAQKAVESLIRICKLAETSSEEIILFWLGSPLF